MESTAVWNLKPEQWGSQLSQEKYQEEKACDNNNNNEKKNPLSHQTSVLDFFKPPSRTQNFHL